MTSDEMTKMHHLDIINSESGVLMDICGVIIDDTLPIKQRVISFTEQIKNPYRFRCGTTPVTIEFMVNSKPLEQKVSDYFIGLKGR